jgi:signal transduction histidine kinase
LTAAPASFYTLPLFTSLPGCYLVVLPDSPRYTITGVTDAFASLVGVRKDALLNQSIADAFGNLEESGLVPLQNLHVALDHALNSKSEYAIPCLRRDFINHQSGAPEFTAWRCLAKPLPDAAGAVQYLLYFIEDITQRLKLEENEKKASAEKRDYRKYINAAQTAMFTFAPVRNAEGNITDFRFVLANPAFAAYVGQTPDVLEGALGSTWFPGYLTNGVFDMYKHTFLTSEVQRKNIHYNVDGHDLYLDLMSTRISEEVLVTFTDNTPLRKAQLQLERSVDELMRSNTSLEEFAHITSHDLQEPLRKIHFYTNRLLDKAGLPEDAQNYIAKVNQSARRMSGLIKDLLDYARLSQRTEHFEPVDLNAILEKVLSDYEVAIAQKQATIQSTPLETIDAVPLHMNQLFFNLIGNALKFMKRDVPPVLHIRGETLSETQAAGFPQLDVQKTYYRISIQDNGIGFQQEYAEKIFTIFQRLNDRSRYSGHGIGLALCKKITEAHKGVIYAEGKPAEGAVFTVILPCRQA